jgi:hypothetical protein
MLIKKLSGGTLMPAYGRDYNKRADIVADLNAGMDFKYQSFNGDGYCSIRDLADGQFQVRNANARKLWTVNIKSGVAK